MVTIANNGLLYAIIGALGATAAGGAYYIISGHPQTSAQSSTPAQINNPPSPAPPAPPAASAPSFTDPERNALVASIDQSITAGDFVYAERLLTDATQRYAGNVAWPPLQQRLTKARADREAQLRQTEARWLVAEARRFAQVGDFSDAESLLQQATQQSPALAEITLARNDIAALSTERGQRFSERYQYEAAVDQALTSDRLWEAERLLAEYSQRFGADEEYRVRNERLSQMRNAATWQARINQARAHIATARQAMDHGDFAEAERQLAVADSSAPGFPEINGARADLSRGRITAETQQEEIALILRAIDQAFQTRRYDDAERAIDDGRRRYGAYSGWPDLQRRAIDVRQGNDRQAEEIRAKNARAMELAVAARRSAVQGDVVASDRSLAEASALVPNLPEIAIARAEMERVKADRARQEAEARAIVATADAALARKQYADAERLIGEGNKRYPASANWAELTRKLDNERKAAAFETRSATPPSAAPAKSQTPPAPAAVTSAPPTSVAVAPVSNPRLEKLVADARDAIKRSDLAAAEMAVAEAKKLNPQAAVVTAVHAEIASARVDQARQEADARTVVILVESALVRQQFAEAERLIGDGNKRYPTFVGWSELSRKLVLQRHIMEVVSAGHEAIKRSDWSAAEKSVSDAEKLDAKATTVTELRAELKAAEEKDKSAAKDQIPPANPRTVELVAAAREALKRSDLAGAEKSVAEAEKLDAKATIVIEVRDELKATEGRSRDNDKARSPQQGNRK